MSHKYETILKAITGRGTTLDLLPIHRINEIITDATDRLPADCTVRHTPEDRIDMNVTEEHLIIYGFFEIVSSKNFELVHITPINSRKGQWHFSHPNNRSSDSGTQLQ